MINFRLYDRNGTTLIGLLPDALSWSVSFEFSEVGALSLDYSSEGVNASALTELREIALVDESGAEYPNARFVITGISRNRTQVIDTISVTARSILWRFDTALAYPDGGIASGEVSRFFDTQTPGSILKTLIDDAQTRGALTGMTYSFNATTDSNSAAWGVTTTQEYPARSSILSIMRGLTDLGILEVRTQGRALAATKGDGVGTDKTTGANPIVLRYGYNLTEAPEVKDAGSIAGAVLVEGDDGLLVERTNATTVSTFGRLETSLTASGIDDTAVVQSLGDSFLTTTNDANRQLTVGLTMQTGTPQPLTDFGVGDYVYTATVAGLERVRVRQITMSMSDGNVTATATLGDRLYENDINVARKLAAITSGSVQLGNGQLPTTVPTVVADTVAPAAPTGLTGTSTAYLSGSDPRARVALTWTAPTLNADGTALTDLRSYDVLIRLGASDAWEFAGSVTTNSATLSELQPGTSYRYSVRAVDASGNKSALATELVQTSAGSGTVGFTMTPSTPTATSRLGTISIAWNGLTSAGATPPAGFSFVEVHASTTNNFTPSAGTYEGRMNGADIFVMADLTYNVTYYIKLVPVSTGGVKGTASAQAASSIQPLVDTDIIANTISGAKIASGTITASDKIIGNTITGALIQALAIDAGKIAANAITADKINAGAITGEKISATAIDGKVITGATVRTSSASTRVEMNSSGLFVYNAGTPVVSLNASGTASFSGTITANAGTIGGFTLDSGSLFSGNLTLSSSGTITGGNSSTLFYGYVNVGGGSPTGDRFQVSGNSNFNGQALFSGNVTSQTHFFSPFANNVTAASNAFMNISLVGGVPTGSGRITWTTASSQRYKHDITPLREVDEMSPKRLLDLPARAFRYNEGYVDPEDDRAEVLMPGFIAEEVDAIYPIAADYLNGQVNSWNERMIVPGMLALIQDLTKELAEIKATLNGESA